MAISGAMGRGPIGDGEFPPTGRAGLDEPSGRAGRWFHRPGQAAGGAYALQGVTRVAPCRARESHQRRGCYTRVQESGVGGQLSKLSVSNVKPGGITPYRTYAASTWVPDQLPAPLDRPTLEIGQLSSGVFGRVWTVAGTESDSCPSGLAQAGRDGWPEPGALPGGADQGVGESGTVVPSDVGAPAG